MSLSELIGIILVVYGIWFTYKGILRMLGNAKDWWRPMQGKTPYPYPAAGILLGVCFVLLGTRFALSSTWDQSPLLGYVGGGLFVIVLVVGIVQPRFLHPKWYGCLWDRFGKEGMLRLTRAASELEDEEWCEIDSSALTFDRWVDRVMPPAHTTGRAFKQSEDRS